MKVTLHPGFHKTGTSGVQAVLRANRRRIAPLAGVLLLRDLGPAVAASTAYATTRDPADLVRFQAAFAAGLAAHRERPALIISCEGLCGRTPGKRGISDYSAALPLCKAMAQALEDVISPSLVLTFAFTTRAAQPWLSSAWRHNLAGYRVTEDFAEWAALYGHAAQFDTILQQVQHALPAHRVISLPLEQALDDVLGPAGPVLRLAGFPVRRLARFAPVGRVNTGPSAAQATELLRLNRLGLTDGDLRAAKRAYLAQA